MPYISGGGGSGGIATLTAADTSVVVAGTATAKTVRTNTLDVIAADHAPAADWSNNSHKITSLAVATASTDAASLANTLDQFGAPAGNVAFNSHKITGLANGSAASDAAAFGQIAAGQVLTQAFAPVTLGSDGTFDVSGIPGTGNALILSLFVRGTRSAVSDSMGLRFNNDSAANYNYSQVVGTGSTATGVNVAGANAILIVQIVAGTATAGFFSTVEIVINNYAGTSFAKCATGISAGSNAVAVTGGGNWNSTAAITRVQLFGATTANLLTGSILYGYLRT